MSVSLYAQRSNAKSPGYLDKRFLIKTNLVTPVLEKGWMAEVEYALTRRITLNLDVSSTKDKFIQKLASYKSRHGFYPQDRAVLNNNMAYIKVKYNIQDYPPAPRGTYAYASYGYGFASADGHYYDDRSRRLIPYQINDITSQHFAVGVGHQQAFLSSIVLDFGLGFAAGNLKINETVSDEVQVGFQSFADQYGPNLQSFGNLMNGGLGLHAHIKIGFLLF